MKDHDKYFGDVCYDVWRAGGNPDRINPDRIDAAEADGIEAEDAARRELRHQRYRWQPNDEEPMEPR